MAKGSIYLVDKNYGRERIPCDSGSLEFEARLLKEKGYNISLEKHPVNLNARPSLVICHVSIGDLNKILNFYDVGDGKNTLRPVLFYHGRSEQSYRTGSSTFEQLISFDNTGLYSLLKVNVDEFLMVVNKFVTNDFNKKDLKDIFSRR
jgi:hypothetical protein